MNWNKITEELILFIDKLNKKHKTIKFDYEISSKQIEFLNTIIHIQINNTKFKQLYSVNQETNEHTYMHNQNIPNL